MPAFPRWMQGHSHVVAVDERVGVSLSLNNVLRLRFGYHGTNSGNLASIMQEGLRGTHIQQRNTMRAHEKRHVESGRTQSDVTERTHLMQSPYSIDNDRCSSGKEARGQ